MTQLMTEPKKGTAPVTATPTKDGSISAFGPARATVPGTPLKADEVRRLDTFWRACNYLAAGMIYLRANPLLREPLQPEHVKLRLLGHWGSSPGLSFAYIHLNRLITKYDLDVIFLAGPGHGAAGRDGAYTSLHAFARRPAAARRAAGAGRPRAGAARARSARRRSGSRS